MGILIKGMDEIPEDGAVLVVRHDNGKVYIKHACTYGYSMELVKLPAVQPDHNADISKKAEGDCISRQAAIDALHGYFDGMLETDTWSPCDVYGLIELLPSVQPERVCVATVTLTDEQVKEVAEKAKNAVISVIESESHWIPCGERLPEEKQSVLVTDGSIVWVCDIISTDEGYKWEDSHGYWLDLDEWTAWMPLPEPYRGGDVE